MMRLTSIRYRPARAAGIGQTDTLLLTGSNVAYLGCKTIGGTHDMANWSRFEHVLVAPAISSPV